MIIYIYICIISISFTCRNHYIYMYIYIHMLIVVPLSPLQDPWTMVQLKFRAARAGQDCCQMGGHRATLEQRIDPQDSENKMFSFPKASRCKSAKCLVNFIAHYVHMQTLERIWTRITCAAHMSLTGKPNITKLCEQQQNMFNWPKGCDHNLIR